MINKIFNDLSEQTEKAFLTTDTKTKEMLMQIAENIYKQKILFDKTSNEEEKKKIIQNIKHLKTQINLKVEQEKIKLAKKGEEIIDKAIKFIVKTYFPIV